MKNLSMEKTNPTFLGGWTLNMFFLIRNTVIFFFLVPTFSTWDLCSFQRSFIWLILRKGITQSHQFNEVGDSEFQPRNSSQHLFDDLVPKPFTMGYLYIYILWFYLLIPPPKEILTPSQVTSLFLGSYGIPMCSFPTSVDSTLLVTTIPRSSTAGDTRLEKTTGEVPTNKKPAIIYMIGNHVLFQKCLLLKINCYQQNLQKWFNWFNWYRRCESFRWIREVQPWALRMWALWKHRHCPNVC